MSDQADGLRQLVRARSGPTTSVRLKEQARLERVTAPERPPRDREARAGFFASLVACWASSRASHRLQKSQQR